MTILAVKREPDVISYVNTIPINSMRKNKLYVQTSETVVFKQINNEGFVTKRTFSKGTILFRLHDVEASIVHQSKFGVPLNQDYQMIYVVEGYEVCPNGGIRKINDVVLVVKELNLIEDRLADVHKSCDTEGISLYDKLFKDCSLKKFSHIVTKKCSMSTNFNLLDRNDISYSFKSVSSGTYRVTELIECEATGKKRATLSGVVYDENHLGQPSYVDELIDKMYEKQLNKKVNLIMIHNLSEFEKGCEEESETLNQFYEQLARVIPNKFLIQIGACPRIVAAIVFNNTILDDFNLLLSLHKVGRLTEKSIAGLLPRKLHIRDY